MHCVHVGIFGVVWQTVITRSANIAPDPMVLLAKAQILNEQLFPNEGEPSWFRIGWNHEELVR
jgi:hypothetical protein